MTARGRSIDSPHRAATIIGLDDVALDDSDKVFTVPAARAWQVLYLRYEYTATATVGTRTPTLEFRNDNSDDIVYTVAGPTITASNSSTQNADSSGGVDLFIPIALTLHAGWDVRVADTAAIAAAADDMIVHLTVREIRTL